MVLASCTAPLLACHATQYGARCLKHCSKIEGRLQPSGGFGIVSKVMFLYAVRLGLSLQVLFGS